MKWIHAFIICLCATMAAHSQVAPVERFLENNPDIKSYFIYQSTLRVLNQEGDPDFDKLIKDVKKINAYVAGNAQEMSGDHFGRMIEELAGDGFDVLVDARHEGAMIKAFGKGEGKEAYYVVTAKDASDFALLEIDGQLDLNYISSLTKVNLTKLGDILED